jgi:Mn-dependent DtxR family transcriptional regulator
MAEGPDMLEELLLHLQHGGTYHISALAHQFGVSEALMMQMLADLARMGYLRPVEADCSQGCAACPAGAACQPLRSARLWTTR